MEVVHVASTNGVEQAPRGGQVPKKQLEERFSMFSAGQWAELIRGSLALSATGSQAAIRRRRRRNHDDVHKRADRAMQLVQMGELSAGRLALDGAQVAGGDHATLQALTDQRRRPAVPRAPLSQSILEAQPEAFSLDEGLFVQSLRSSRRGAAAAFLALQPTICNLCLTPEETRRSCFGLRLFWREARLPMQQWKGSGWVGSLRSRSRTEASEELWSETFFEGWSPGQWPNKWQQGRKPRQPHSSTPSPRRQVARVWPTSSRA